VIALDGARADALRFAETPHMDALSDGSWSSGYRGAWSAWGLTVSDGDTVSGPNHVAIMTGGQVGQTGVTSNDASVMSSGNYVDFPHYLSVLESEDPALDTAYLFTWPTDAFIACEADYILLGDEDGNAERAGAMISGAFEDPNWDLGRDSEAIFLFFDFIDGTGHSDGFSLDVDTYVAALERADRLIGDLLEAIRARPDFDGEDWQILVTSDHGGYGTGHGGRGGHRETIPFIVSSRTLEAGQLPDGTRNIDVAPTVLTHFDVDIPSELTGSTRTVGAVPLAEIDLANELVAHYGFDGDLTDAVGAQDASFGASATVEAEEGKFGGHLSLSGHPAYVSLPDVADLSFTADDAFTVALWMRADQVLEGDPVVIGNKDWVSGLNPGWALLANEGGDNSVGSNYGTGDDRVDVETLDYAPLEWVFLAAVYRPGGVSITYLGQEDRRLEWVGQHTHLTGAMSSGDPIRIGQDGTASYPFSFAGDVDEVSIWRRALSHAEIQALHANGNGLRMPPTR